MLPSTPDILDFSKLSPEGIEALLQEYHLSLTVEEVLIIQNKLLKRPPTFAECVLWSIQGSEHCSYKSTRKYLKNFNTSGPHVVLGPKEDAGIISIATDKDGRRFCLVISHESHNHPSQIVPYEGAATGVGGNIRDVCCMGAEVVAIADSLRFGDINLGKTHWITNGVVNGIAGYGNPVGVATLAGDLYFDPGYNENCLVSVVTLGLVREDHIIHSYAPSNADQHVFILVGKPTDNSGFGGASFASASLSEEKQEANKGAVQEPNAFLQRHLLKANYALFHFLQEKKLLDRVGFKDLGAGGIACASVELAEAQGYGAEIMLENVPVGMQGLHPAVILCSETQERFMWVVPPDLVDIFLDHYNVRFALPEVSQGAFACVIGKIRSDGLYVVKYHEKVLVNAQAIDVTQGLSYDRPHKKTTNQLNEPVLTLSHDYQALFLKMLAHENIASRASIFETYDKQVQGRTLIEAGRADAGVMQVFNEEKYPAEIRSVGVALSIDHNPRYNKIDAYWGAVNAVCEAVRNVIAVGATPLAITDCLCFGNPENPHEMQRFIDAVHGILDACRAFKLKTNQKDTLPVVAGNVSLYNESVQGAIPPSPIISCVGVIEDIKHAINYDLKSTTSYLLLVGSRKDECGGGVYYALHNALGIDVPKPDLMTINAEVQAVQESIAQGLILAAHDISDGGVAIALAEMSFTNEIGFEVNIPGQLATDKKLFSETGGFVLEVAREALKAVQEIFRASCVPLTVIGETQAHKRIMIKPVIDIAVQAAKDRWMQGLRERLL